MSFFGFGTYRNVSYSQKSCRTRSVREVRYSTGLTQHSADTAYSFLTLNSLFFVLEVSALITNTEESSQLFQKAQMKVNFEKTEENEMETLDHFYAIVYLSLFV